MSKNIDLRRNRIKYVAHGFFFSLGVYVAEPSTILPLMVSYFSSNNVLIGVFSALHRGGAVLMQLLAAFYAQSYPRVIKPLRLVFFFRFVAWFGMGYAIFLFYDQHPGYALWSIGIGLFMFSFSAGFGTVYFHELLGKIFTHNYRGVTLAYRQLFMGFGGVISVVLTAILFNKFEAPLSFAYTFMVSAVIMSAGYFFLGTVKEDEKQNISSREDNFILFLKNAISLLKTDKVLRIQILSRLITFSYLMALPFVIKNTGLDMKIGQLALGSAVPLLLGNILGNIGWSRITRNGFNKTIVMLSVVFLIVALGLTFFTHSIGVVILLYFLAGAGADGLKVAFTNLMLIISPEDKRPVYIAIQNNISSFGLFFSIPGGVLLNVAGYHMLIIVTIIVMILGLFFSSKINRGNHI